MKKYFAELVGTFFLVFFGVGTAVITGGVPGLVGIAGIALAFGLGLVAAAYAIGPISGCHINPAVSIGVWAAGRLKTTDLIGYWIGQFIGLGQNGFGAGYQGGYSLTAAILYEFVATLLFVLVILGSTQKAAPSGFAGLVIGLTLVAIHLLGIHITGTSVNPARSFGPAVFVGGQAIQQLWVFLLIPTLGGAAAGLLFKLKALAAD